MQFSQQIKSLRRQKGILPKIAALPIFTRIKQEMKKINKLQGIFAKESFCFSQYMIKQNAKKVQMLAWGLFQQGAIVWEIAHQIDYFIIDSKKENHVQEIKHKFIVDYTYVQDCFRKFKKLPISSYFVKQIKQKQKNQQSFFDHKVFQQNKIHQLNQTQKICQRTIASKINRQIQIVQNQQKTCSQQKNNQKYKFSRIIIEEQQEQQIKTPIKNLLTKNLLQNYISKQQQSGKKNIQVCRIEKKSLSCHKFKINEMISHQLESISTIYKHKNDPREFAYLRAMAQIRSCPFQIKEIEQITHLSIPLSIRSSIGDFLKTGRMKKLQTMQRFDLPSQLTLLTGVWGIGQAKARTLIQANITTIQLLRSKSHFLNKNQKIGLKYYQQFKQRIPRNIVTQMFIQIKETFIEAFGENNHRMQVAGSYRRLKQTCGDIDIIIAREDGGVEPNLLLEFVKILKMKGFITDCLTEPRGFDGKTPSTYMGVCFFKQKHHRIDIKHFPIEMYPFAILYFTGSNLFNRQMRIIAHHRGLFLNEKGFKIKQRNGKQKIYKGKKIPIFKEQKQIFQFLGLQYSAPQQRDL